jgi:serine-type D-Ala-D-Ala carboxypeptidase/endopeptidase (penicillin-binding protein 4)
VFSFDGRCHGLALSQKYTGMPSVAVTCWCSAISLPWSQVSDRRSRGGSWQNAAISASRTASAVCRPGRCSSNPSSALPASYSGDPRVAAYTSPPYADYAKFILKVSSNIGANLAICQLAVTAGSHDCTAGFAVIQSFLQRIGVDPGQVELADGRGGDPVDRLTPQVAVALLRYWLTTPDAIRFRLSLPILGVDGSLYNSCTTCAAKGKVFAKTGTFIAADDLNNRLAVTAKALSGYLDAGGGRFDTFFLVTNGAVASDLNGALTIGDDLADVAAILQEDATAGY